MPVGPTYRKYVTVPETDRKKAASEKLKEEIKLLSIPVKQLGFSDRVLHCLYSCEIYTLGRLVSYSKMELLKLNKFGPQSLSELESLIQSKGFTFGYKPQQQS